MFNNTAPHIMITTFQFEYCVVCDWIETTHGRNSRSKECHL